MPTQATIIAWVLFSCLGMVYWAYGKMKGWWQPKVLGVGLMVFPYFVSGDIWLWSVGGGLSFLIIFARD